MNARLRALLMAGTMHCTACAGAALAVGVLLDAVPALAQNYGVGGDGGFAWSGQDWNNGGAGGALGQNGGNAPIVGVSGGGGGGGGGGGAGGTAGGSGASGAGSNGNGGDGGPGGAHGLTSAAPPPITTPLSGVAGTDGEPGGTGTTGDSGAGGGGGAGGYGLVVTGAGTVSNTSSIDGGIGGDGGAGAAPVTATFAPSGGAGGGGGIGIQFTATGATLNNNAGAISGGDGGAGGPIPGAGVNSITADGGLGGAGVFGSSITITNSGTISAGNGGDAGVPGADSSPGIAGAGGAGITGDNNTITSSGTINGGNGGNNPSTGRAGAGGAAITGNNNTITNTGTIQGGSGGAISSSGLDILGGDGGHGITGSDLTIINGGIISGGAGGAAPYGSGADGHAINFTGGVNTLEIWSGSNITDDVVASSFADTFRLGGTTSDSFDVSQIGPSAKYQGFGVFEKTGASTWTLMGSPGQATPWTIYGGTLSISSADSLGTLGLTFDTRDGLLGTLQTTGFSPINYTESVTLNANGTFDIGLAASLTLSGVVSGSSTAALNKTGPGVLTLTGTNTYTGPTNVGMPTVPGGALAIDGDNSAATGLITVYSGGTLSGGEGNLPNTGMIGGSVLLDGGALLSEDTSDDGINKVTINGDLTAQNGGNLDYNYDVSPSGDPYALQVQVGGTVNLNGGMVTVTTEGGAQLDPGIVYGLVKGTVVGSGLTLASAPAGFGLQITGTRINLAPAAPGTFNYWDGTNNTPTGIAGGSGGSGTWQGTGAGAPTNWTDQNGSQNGTLTAGAIAIFMTQGGTVTVDSATYGAVNATGMQFFVDGYTVEGATPNDTITLVPDANGQSPIYVGDNMPDGAAVTAMISAQLTGSSQLRKADLGTLVLSGNNTYTGGTEIDAGVLSVSSDTNLGDAAGGLTFDGGILRVTGTSFTSTPRTIDWEAFGGGFDIADADNTFTVSQALGGTGSGTDRLIKNGPGTLELSGTNTYTGPTTINDGTLLLSGSGSIASPTTINPNGTLAGTGTVFGDVNNAGTLAPGPLASGFGVLTIDGSSGGGNYVGNGGMLRIRTALGDDSSPTDQLVINNGTASGSTGVRVTNRGGSGAVTNIGIPIIVAEGTTMMDSTAFSLSGPVVAGLYQYKLFQGTPDGSGTAQQEQSWYLRNTTNVPNPQPLTRPEAPIYGLMPGIARALNVSTVGTFHERNGDQQLVRDNGRGWGRLFGHHREQGFSGTLNERFKGHAGGIQAGLDLFNWRQPDGSGQRVGVFFAFAAAKGDAYGLALATPDRFVGDLKLSATSVGAYWRHVAPTGAYLDAVLMGSFYDGSATSTNAIGISMDGSGATASLEAGLPIPLGGGITLEPQAQIIWQTLSLDGKDAFTSVDYGVPSAWQGRLGVRLAGNFAPWGWTSVRPYLKASLVADWADEHRTIFAGTDGIRTGKEVNMAEVGAGFVAQFTPSVGVWGTVDYSTDISGGRESREIWRANAGLRVAW